MRQVRVVAALVVVLTVLVAAPGTPPAAVAQQGDGIIVIRTLSTRADLVTGGDARVAVDVPSGTDPAGLRLAVDGREVSGVLSPVEGGVEGVVTGLVEGPNIVSAVLPDGRAAQLTVTNHPRGGPLFAGPQIQPWACTTEANGLGPPSDEQCNADPVVRYVFANALTGQFMDYDPAAPPPDLLIARTTTDEGQEVPFIVRIERGTLDRSIYDIAVLADPAEGLDAPAAWNGKVNYRFGGSCSARHSQSAPGANLPGDSADVLVDDQPLGLGFAVASAGLNTLGQNCNLAVSAEAVSMVSEHIGDTYGQIRYTIGVGCSGGSINQHVIAESYPGLLDGLLPSCSFSDLWSPITEVQECTLLEAYFQAEPAMWADPADRRAVDGSQLGTTCAAWVATFGPVIDPETTDPDATACDVPPEDQYNAQNNPDGVRCSVQDYQANIWGLRAADGFAQRPLDNTGVQYGLQALADGTISGEQFVALNAGIGGYDIDRNPVPERMRADTDAARTGYRSASLVSGHGLADVAILDQRGSSNAEVHTDFWSYATRARLEAANGTAANQVIWTNERSVPGSPASQARAFTVMDEWLAAVEADDTDVPTAQKVLDARPEGAVDGACFIAEQFVTDTELCASRYPFAANPRIAAGGPLSSDVWRCVLIALDRGSHAGEFDDDQWATLQAAFPDGVCDWDAPPPGQEPGLAWPAYADGPRGASLGPAPSSVPFGPGSAPVRLGGSDRTATAVEVSTATYATAATVVLARDDDPADALTGAPLASALGAPLLLAGKDEVSAATMAEIARLGARHIVLLGGEAALGPAVAEQIRAAGLPMRRLGGIDRFATAAAIAEDLGPRDRVLLAAGDGTFADALAAGALGAAAGAPVLLVTRDTLPPATAAALAGRGSAAVVGGEAAVGASVLAAVADLVPEVERIAGPDRYATAAAAADRAVAAGATSDDVWIATGRDFPDALAVAATARRTPLLLVDGQDPAGQAAALAWLADHAVAGLRIAGGIAAVGTQAAAQLANR